MNFDEDINDFINKNESDDDSSDSEISTLPPDVIQCQLDQPSSLQQELNESTVWVDNILFGREQFTGQQEIHNIEVLKDENGKVNFIKIFEYFLNDDIIDEMVNYTNIYGQILKNSQMAQNSRMTRWKNVDREEMKKFFGIILLMGIIQLPTIEHYWKLDNLYHYPLMHHIQMSYNRFSCILKCWHFAEFQPNSDNRTYKIDQFILKIVDKFRSLYTPSEILVVDMVKFKGKLQAKTCNPSKSKIYVLRVHKLCTPNGYTWSYEICSAASGQIKRADKITNVVMRLCAPLFDEGRLVITDEHYSSVALADCLKYRKTDLCGRLRKNSINLPKRVVKEKLNRGEYIARQKDSCITVFKWRENRDILMITTCHGDKMGKSAKMGEKMKPKAVIEYNNAKRKLDIGDQFTLIHSPFRKSLTWYKKVAVDLLFKVAVTNARCLYNELSADGKLSGLQTQEQLIRHYLGVNTIVTETIKPFVTSSETTDKNSATDTTPVVLPLEITTEQTKIPAITIKLVKSPTVTESTMESTKLPTNSIKSGRPPEVTKPVKTRVVNKTKRMSQKHHLEKIPRKDNKPVRRRCTSCYKKWKTFGSSSDMKVKQIQTICRQCNKAFCLECFNEVHS